MSLSQIIFPPTVRIFPRYVQVKIPSTLFLVVLSQDNSFTNFGANTNFKQFVSDSNSKQFELNLTFK